MVSSFFPHFLIYLFLFLASVVVGEGAGVREKCQVEQEIIPMDDTLLTKVKGVSLPRILADMGIQPAYRYTPDSAKGKFLYHAPYRKDNHPSFSVFISRDGTRWLWKDHSTGESGNSLDLLLKMRWFADWREAAQYIAKTYCGVITQDPSVNLLQRQIVPPPAIRDESVGRILALYPLSGSPAVTYVTQVRKIPLDVASRYLQYAVYTYDARKNYSGIAWPTLRGGWSIRWAKDLGKGRGKSFVGPAGISLFHSTKRESDSCDIFEGVFDFLSFLVMRGPSFSDTIVLNSTENVVEVMPLLHKYAAISCFFDNDAAGKKATNDILLAMGDKATDCSWRYAGFKDYNDYLIHSILSTI